MIKSIKLKKFKCFIDNYITFKVQTIIVGKNNAGKSTMIEALRLIAFAGKKSLSSNFSQPLAMYDFPIDYKGIKIDTDKLKIDLRSAIYLYDEGYATIEALFDDNSKIMIYINSDVAFATFFDSAGDNIWKKDRVSRCNFSKLSIMPQIGPIRENEKMLIRETILNDMETYLSSRHFRNEIFYFKTKRYAEFKMLAEASWDGLRLHEIEPIGEYLSLMVQDDNFPCEIGLMGSGIQIWLQIIWFLCKSKDSTTLIFDEPDIYMHPDLQIKLFNIIRQRNVQMIIATHSVEIISQVEPKYLLSIEKSSRDVRFANSSRAAQKVIEDIGGISNLSLIRIGQIKKCLFVEGKDLDIIGPFINKLYPKIEPSIYTIPIVSLGGKAQLSEAYGVAKLFHLETQGEVQCYCILDRDYESLDSSEELIRTAKENFLELIIWKRKEIENYLLNPNVIFRTLKIVDSRFEEFMNRFITIIDSFYEDIETQYMQDIQLADKSLALKNCRKQAKARLENEWTTLESKLQIVPGKKVLKKVREMLKYHFNLTCSNRDIIKHFTIEEVPDDIVSATNIIYHITSST